jgi:phosphohistidine phosphatase
LTARRRGGSVQPVPLRVDLLRHGLATPADGAGDEARALAPEGVATATALGNRLGRLKWRPERAYASPLRRARETAAVVLSAAGVGLEAEILSELAPECEPEDVAAALDTELGDARHVLLVGHQPLLGQLAGYWTGNPMALSPGEFLGVELEAVLARRSGQLVERIAF